MHGLINCAVQGFVVDKYGQTIWDDVVRRAQLSVPGFEPMLTYDDALTPQTLGAVCHVLERSEADVLEDIGTYLVSHPNTEALRRLMRFGGVNFTDFLHSLDDLPDRARLAVPNLNLPRIELREEADGSFSLLCDAQIAGFGHVLVGILRTMADDYGVLALLDHFGEQDASERIGITLIETDYQQARSFHLGARA